MTDIGLPCVARRNLQLLLCKEIPLLLTLENINYIRGFIRSSSSFENWCLPWKPLTILSLGSRLKPVLLSLAPAFNSLPRLWWVVISIFHISLYLPTGVYWSDSLVFKAQGLFFFFSSQDISNISSKFSKNLSSCFGMIWWQQKDGNLTLDLWNKDEAG